MEDELSVRVSSDLHLAKALNHYDAWAKALAEAASRVTLDYAPMVEAFRARAASDLATLNQAILDSLPSAGLVEVVKKLLAASAVDTSALMGLLSGLDLSKPFRYPLASGGAQPPDDNGAHGNRAEEPEAGTPGGEGAGGTGAPGDKTQEGRAPDPDAPHE
jgi:hypothetical protein